MKTNCPNCGAVIDPEQHKCSYCGTSYFDMSEIDLTTGSDYCYGGKANNSLLIMKVC